jgi:hypothetical protein
MATVQNADTYFQEEVLLNEAWVNADQDMKSRALKNAENMLYRYFKRFNRETKPVPDVAIYEQAYFILLIDETIQKSALGVKQVSVSGLSISVDAPKYPISPEVRMILGGNVRTGRSLL